MMMRTIVILVALVALLNGCGKSNSETSRAGSSRSQIPSAADVKNQAEETLKVARNLLSKKNFRYSCEMRLDAENKVGASARLAVELKEAVDMDHEAEETYGNSLTKLCEIEQEQKHLGRYSGPIKTLVTYGSRLMHRYELSNRYNGFNDPKTTALFEETGELLKITLDDLMARKGEIRERMNPAM